MYVTPSCFSKDPHITVRQKSAKILGGLVHSGFITGDSIGPLLANLRKRIRPRMARFWNFGIIIAEVKGKCRTLTSFSGPGESSGEKIWPELQVKLLRRLATLTTLCITGIFLWQVGTDWPAFVYSGILGLCAFVEAFPYDVPSFLPGVLMELSTHLNDPQVADDFIYNRSQLFIHSQPRWPLRKVYKSSKGHIRTIGR